MGVVIFLGFAAAVILKFYRWTQRSGAEGQNAMLSIRTQAAAVASLAGSIFDIISALTTAKVTVSRTVFGATTPKSGLPAGFRFGHIGDSAGPGGIPETA